MEYTNSRDREQWQNVNASGNHIDERGVGELKSQLQHLETTCSHELGAVVEQMLFLGAFLKSRAGNEHIFNISTLLGSSFARLAAVQTHAIKDSGNGKLIQFHPSIHSQPPHSRSLVYPNVHPSFSSALHHRSPSRSLSLEISHCEES